jgi:hypothetical protein
MSAFESHNGLQSDIAPCLRSARSGLTHRSNGIPRRITGSPQTLHDAGHLPGMFVCSRHDKGSGRRINR